MSAFMYDIVHCTVLDTIPHNCYKYDIATHPPPLSPVAFIFSKVLRFVRHIFPPFFKTRKLTCYIKSAFREYSELRVWYIPSWSSRLLFATHSGLITFDNKHDQHLQHICHWRPQDCGEGGQSCQGCIQNIV